MRPAGEAAFARRREDRSGVYAFEQRNEPQLEPEQEERFRANEAAWTYFMARPPSYRKPALWWVVSAKKPETRERRLATLIEDSVRRPADQAADAAEAPGRERAGQVRLAAARAVNRRGSSAGCRRGRSRRSAAAAGPAAHAARGRAASQRRPHARRRSCGRAGGPTACAARPPAARPRMASARRARRACAVAGRSVTRRALTLSRGASVSGPGGHRRGRRGPGAAGVPGAAGTVKSAVRWRRARDRRSRARSTRARARLEAARSPACPRRRARSSRRRPCPSRSAARAARDRSRPRGTRPACPPPAPRCRAGPRSSGGAFALPTVTTPVMPCGAVDVAVEAHLARDRSASRSCVPPV